ncbi:MAG: 3-deoxy-7-phosphoheptulonate synthase [Lentisphaeria bacterium]|nr:3-deoxy-7-phosphoheptulonate synthase [Lentisphaeria bacterium]
MINTDDLRVEAISPLVTPHELKQQLPLTETANDTVARGRKEIEDILAGRDNRFLVITGPCSIHDEEVALDYAKRLAVLAEELKDQLLIVMRVYFEKPRTTVGWRGLIYDPDLNDTGDINKGIYTARKLLLEINNLGLPCATEMLDPIIPQYISNLVSWAAIGARTTESQTHRDMVSGLSMPVGFKNGTDGNSQIALDAIKASKAPHYFLGVDQEGRTSIVNTLGNDQCHIILRGGRGSTNYDEESVSIVQNALSECGEEPLVMVDCSHANSGKKHTQQEVVLRSVLDQRLSGNTGLFGVMIESNVNEGSQKIPADLADLKYGVSITDECISWQSNQDLLREAAEKLK